MNLTSALLGVVNKRGYAVVLSELFMKNKKFNKEVRFVCDHDDAVCGFVYRLPKIRTRKVDGKLHKLWIPGVEMQIFTILHNNIKYIRFSICMTEKPGESVQGRFEWIIDIKKSEISNP
jgi:hypothetical protein